MRSLRRSLFLLPLLLAPLVQAQTPALRTHQVNADDTVTFRFVSPNAHRVQLTMDTLPQPLAMTEVTGGVWSVTTPVLKPEIYDYSFIVDGVREPDPHNFELHPSYAGVESLVTVPGAPAEPWELAAVPHGTLTLHRFTTHIARSLPKNQSAYVVYTPAGYDPTRKGGYPVLYLLHGYLDNQDAWTIVGRAHFVLDSLIASGKAVPMIVVMPLGYGDWTFLTHGFSQWDDAATVDNNTNLFVDEMEQEVMPAVEKQYNIAPSREKHAVAGLSMGGLETLALGLGHSDQFAYVAAMSAAVQHRHFDEHFPRLTAKQANLKLLWVSVGTDDHLLQPNRDFVAWARGKGFRVHAVETPGAHQWPVWRENLVHVLPLLFR